ncbi:MAG: DUF1573 domain-containing protein [Flavobacteriaceae bacterium]|nr:DUF1573 domain-containing protein [Flavobacteriaceae bacterium]
MKFINFFIAILLCFSYSNGLAQAEITFESEVVDYGTIEKGDDGVRKFKFTNTGSSPLFITQVRSSCGCTIPKKPTDSIMPGAEEVIEVKYDTNRVGPIRKTITVSSNAVTPVVALQIKGTVEEPEEEE